MPMVMRQDAEEYVKFLVPRLMSEARRIPSVMKSWYMPMMTPRTSSGVFSL
jgi:hypothetical protein